MKRSFKDVVFRMVAEKQLTAAQAMALVRDVQAERLLGGSEAKLKIFLEQPVNDAAPAAPEIVESSAPPVAAMALAEIIPGQAGPKSVE